MMQEYHVIVYILGIALCFFPLSYVVLFEKWRKAWISVNEPAKGLPSDQEITVVIAARNEELNIPRLLVALNKQSYPKDKMKVIVVDDHSSDRTSYAVRELAAQVEYRLTLLQLPDHIYGKKSAVDQAVREADTEWVICTDADCVPTSEWISSLSKYMTQDLHLIAGPVQFNRKESVFQEFIRMDLVSMIGITGASIHLKDPLFNNGANMSFRRKTFLELEPYKQNTKHSGDDVFLLRGINERYPDGIVFAKDKDCIVKTESVDTFKDFLQQRIRWASKMGSGTISRGNLINTAIIFMTNFFALTFTLLGLVNALIEGSLWNFTLLVGLLTLVLKWVADARFFRSVLPFFNERFSSFGRFLLIDLMHILYVVSFAPLSRYRSYQWKSRKLQ